VPTNPDKTTKLTKSTKVFVAGYFKLGSFFHFLCSIFNFQNCRLPSSAGVTTPKLEAPATLPPLLSELRRTGRRGGLFLPPPYIGANLRFLFDMAIPRRSANYGGTGMARGVEIDKCL